MSQHVAKEIQLSTMAPSSTSLLDLWTDLNRRFFRGALPPISLEWSRRLTSSAGLFVSRIGPRHRLTEDTGAPSPRRCIKLSAVLLQGHRPHPDHGILTTLAHEMIHQWQYDILKRRPNHGADFRRMMTRMNEEGLGITIYHTMGKEVAALAQFAWRCQRCGSIYRRQRRSIHPRRHSCGTCRGPLRELPVAHADDELLPITSHPSAVLGAGDVQLRLPFRID
jgi:predicted SprT family Zn-dependent metalloprotease